MKKSTFFGFGVVVVLLIVFVHSQFFSRISTAQETLKPQEFAQTTDLPPDGGGEFKLQAEDEITEETRAEISQRIQENIIKLGNEGESTRPIPNNSVRLSWPVRRASGNTDFGVDAVGNFVDHNPQAPGYLKDYNCGTRTYDILNGWLPYNHSGVDISPWPFAWNKMYNNQVEVIAAAAGRISYKEDGNYDRNCDFSNRRPNMIAVRHADNSEVWYLHLKKGSLTRKAVGDSVARGERLGLMGSSGSSTAPHLHFELKDSFGGLQDPYRGPCNNRYFSWWITQPPYYNSRINKLMTHSAPPVFRECPNSEITNEKTVFRPGERFFVATYHRDQVIGQQSQLSIIAPNGNVLISWTHSSPGSYPLSYWYWTIQLPTNAATGRWRFRVNYNSRVYEKAFSVTTNSLSEGEEIEENSAIDESNPN